MDRFSKDVNVEFTLMTQTEKENKNNRFSNIYKFIKSKTSMASAKDTYKEMGNKEKITRESVQLMTARLGNLCYQTSKSLMDFFLYYYETDKEIVQAYYKNAEKAE